VVILARLSKKAKDRVQTGIYSQDEDARDWAKDEGYNVVDTVPDRISGTKAMWDRPKARPWVTQPDLMARYQMIVVSKHDRLSRADWRDEGDIRRWAEDNHKVLYLTEQDLRWPPRDANDRQRWNNEAEQSRREWEGTSKRYRRMVRYRNEHNYLAGRPIYGYRAKGINCGESPCVCWERDRVEDFKLPEIYEPEAQYTREAKDRYLAGEALQGIASDFGWHVNTLARRLRNPAIAGRRMDNYYAKTENERKTVLHYDGIITWSEHEQLVARLDSRANRAGISPGNVKMLTGTIVDEAGHPMYAIKARRTNGYYCRTCKGFTVPVKDADDEVSATVIEDFGELPHLIKRIIPGKNHFDQIEKLRRDRDKLDDTADDYFDKSNAITIEIRRLIRLDEEQPEPDAVKWVAIDADSGDFLPWEDITPGRNVIKIAQWWESLDTASRRDWLKENGWKVIAVRDSEMPGGWRLTIDAGWTAESMRQAESLGFPVREFYQELADLPKIFGIPPAGPTA
jgi:DNA invertase Pin-like site-specific DNA recombinase